MLMFINFLTKIHHIIFTFLYFKNIYMTGHPDYKQIHLLTELT